MAHHLYPKALKSGKTAGGQGGSFLPAFQERSLWKSSRKYLQFIFNTFFATFWFYVGEMKYKNFGME